MVVLVYYVEDAVRLYQAKLVVLHPVSQTFGVLFQRIELHLHEQLVK